MNADLETALEELRKALKMALGPGRAAIRVGLCGGKGLGKKQGIREALYEALGWYATASRLGSIAVTARQNRSPEIYVTGALKDTACKEKLERWHASLTHEEDVVLVLVVGSPGEANVVGVGIDLTSLARFEAITRRPGGFERFKKKVLHPEELGLFDNSVSPEVHMARIWAIKESAYKSLPDPKPYFVNWQRHVIISGSSIEPEIRMTDPVGINGVDCGFLGSVAECGDIFMAGSLLLPHEQKLL